MPTFRLGLTGSIGMGKSTTANFFREAGVPVWDADATVHALYGPGGKGTAAIADILPGAITAKGVDRKILRKAFLSDETLPARIESVIHPLVAEHRAAFLTASDAPLVLLDIPLLFETGGEQACDGILVVTAPPSVQRQRVLDREGMTEDAFRKILARQTPDADKRRRADFIIDTSQGLEPARDAVHSIIEALTKETHA
ncbi:dephospho-CoA kinase [Algicella marina]|uniref:Dephospho-CoA kinase n=1 Tax=Algicella marina TaxID=2683284 RepID=A0A6P1T107_9RHOB|nr:dephospho-CoA kinase [Algicella marina]QHQ36594.1 dephospho-CoA kinase [Algicella marina]